MRVLILTLILAGCQNYKTCQTSGPYKVGQRVTINCGTYMGCKGYISGQANYIISDTEICKARYYVTTTECNGTSMSEKLISYYDGLDLDL